jgi:hypothetical protein
MPSAPPAERGPWRRRAALAAITVALASLTYHPICSAVFDCGCSWFFAGAAETCDIHVPGPPDCPVCTQVAAGAAFTAVMLAGWGAVVAFAARRIAAPQRS